MQTADSNYNPPNDNGLEKIFYTVGGFLLFYASAVIIGGLMYTAVLSHTHAFEFSHSTLMNCAYGAGMIAGSIVFAIGIIGDHARSRQSITAQAIHSAAVKLITAGLLVELGLYFIDWVSTLDIMAAVAIPVGQGLSLLGVNFMASSPTTR